MSKWMLNGPGGDFASVTISRLEGQSAIGFYRLILELALEVRPQGPTGVVYLRSLTGEVYVDQRGSLGYLGRLACHGQPCLPIACEKAVRPVAVPLEIELDQRRLQAIESTRAGDLSLRFKLFPDFGDQQRELLIYHRLLQGQWVRLLEEMGYSRLMLLEVPMPDASAEAELQDAATHLHDAQQELTLLCHDRPGPECRVFGRVGKAGSCRSLGVSVGEIVAAVIGA